MTLKCEATAALSVFGETPPAALGWTDRRLRRRPAMCTELQHGDWRRKGRLETCFFRSTSDPSSLSLFPFFPYLAGGLYT